MTTNLLPSDASYKMLQVFVEIGATWPALQANDLFGHSVFVNPSGVAECPENMYSIYTPIEMNQHWTLVKACNLPRSVDSTMIFLMLGWIGASTVAMNRVPQLIPYATRNEYNQIKPS